MPSTGKKTTHDVRALADALVDGRRWGDATGPTAEHMNKKATAFSAAFELGPRKSRYLMRLVEKTISALVTPRSPFAGMMEAPSEIVAFYELFGSTLRSLDLEFERELHGLLTCLLEKLVGADKTISDAQLLTHGFDPSLPEPPVDEDW